MKGLLLRTALIVVIAAAFALSLSCTDTTTPGEPDLGGDVTGTYADYFYDTEAFTGGQNNNGKDGFVPGPEDTATLPIWWWRTIDDYTCTTTITNYNGEKAEVSVEWDINGTMYIDRSDDNQLNPGTKPLAMVAFVRGEFILVGDEWVLDRISPLNYKTTGNEQTVDIVSVRVQSNNFDRTYTDPEEMLKLEDLPLFQEGDEVTVTVTTTNSSDEDWEPPSFAFIHHDKRRNNTTYEGDGVFVKKYIIRSSEGVHHGAADIIHAGTLQNETTDDYNSSVWAIPYHVGSIPTK
ncbi:MAG: hypothetical protein GY771_15540 [bacterium]|nr:hypothetical protein [bacterium]